MKNVDLFNDKWAMNECISRAQGCKLTMLLVCIGMTESLPFDSLDYEPVSLCRGSNIGTFLRIATCVDLPPKNYSFVSYNEIIAAIKTISDERNRPVQDEVGT